MVKNVLAEPEVQKAVSDEKVELSAIFKDKARAIVTSIDADVIDKGNLLQRATSAAICLDKSLLLSGEPTSIVGVQVLLDIAGLIRRKRDEADEEAQRAWQAQRTITLPAVPQPDTLASRPTSQSQPTKTQEPVPTPSVRVKYYTPVPVEPSDDDTNPLFHGLRKQP